MLIILEGLDCTGKSTLARAIDDRIKRTYVNDHTFHVHKSAPTQSWLDEYAKLVTDNYYPGSRRHLILDRFHWGERVWPAFFGRPSILDEYQWNFTEDLLVRNGAIVIYCKREPALIQRDMEKRGEVPFTYKQIQSLQARYRDVLKLTKLPTYFYEIGHNENVARLVDHAQAHEFRITRKIG